MRAVYSAISGQSGRLCETVRDRGLYEDTCVKIGGSWYFKSRSFRNIHRQRSPKGC